MLNYPKVFVMHRILTNMVKRNPKIELNDLGLPLSSVYINMGLIDEGVKYLKLEYQNNPNKNKDKNAEVNFYNNLGVVWNKANKAFRFRINYPYKGSIMPNKKRNGQRIYSLMFEFNKKWYL